jgi:hypothetical protein
LIEVQAASTTRHTPGIQLHDAYQIISKAELEEEGEGRQRVVHTAQGVIVHIEVR